MSAEHDDITNSEIDWLRSFGWDDESIARRLGLTTVAVEMRSRHRDRSAVGRQVAR